MKKILFLFLLAFFLNPSFLFSLQKEYLQSPSGVTFEFAYRAVQPGEVIMVILKENPSVKEVIIRFLGEDYSLHKEGSVLKSFAFIGLDLGLQPGVHVMKIYIRKMDDQWENIQKEIPVAAKEFPVKKLWVDERFVTPPPSALERIKIEAEIIKIAYSVTAPRWLGEGKFIIPSSDEVVPNFGERRVYNNKPRSLHSGVDISSPLGTPVRASNSGRVVLARDLYFAGKTVIIDHGLGLFTLYCHFSRIMVTRGEFVRKGAVIGEVGATGRVTGPHLHWGIKLLGSRIDPFSLLSLPLE